jgi:two-component system, chemotaxis family, chemotaxis protein CheY
MKILVADDDFTSRRLLQQLLMRYGKVDTCISGAEAVELFHISLKEGHPYRLICLDIMMPGISGLDALAGIRELEGAFKDNRRASAKILMVTALDDSESIRTAFRNLCNGYLCKPVDAAALLQRIDELVTVQRA